MSERSESNVGLTDLLDGATRNESMPDVHTRHCCIRHGCKYGDDNCTVVTGAEAQEGPCEQCDEDCSGWQPIATAPHDRPLLLHKANSDMHVGRWVQNPYTGDEAFAIAEFGEHGRAIVHPTHWMPLPAPPNARNQR